jgi:hypothetical protein
MPQIKPEVEAFARIKVLGIGGSGKNALNHMINSKVRGVDFIAVNTDSQDLHNSMSKKKIHIGKNLTRGLGAGMNPELNFVNKKLLALRNFCNSFTSCPILPKLRFRLKIKDAAKASLAPLKAIHTASKQAAKNNLYLIIILIIITCSKLLRENKGRNLIPAL